MNLLGPERASIQSGRALRYSASEKAEIIRLVGQSALPVKRTLEKLGIPRATFYRWCDVYQSGGPEALDDRSVIASWIYSWFEDASLQDLAPRIAKRVARANVLLPYIPGTEIIRHFPGTR